MIMIEFYLCNRNNLGKDTDFLSMIFLVFFSICGALVSASRSESSFNLQLQPILNFFFINNFILQFLGIVNGDPIDIENAPFQLALEGARDLGDCK